MANQNKISTSTRHGSALEHGAAHERDHRQWSRRSFLQSLGIAGSGSILLGNMPVSALMNSPLGVCVDARRIGSHLGFNSAQRGQ
jgi:hypothetical protein